ncbi:MAG: hypothetical protein NVSMB37_3340 [Candidatus Saccharimonadales bacterium]
MGKSTWMLGITIRTGFPVMTLRVGGGLSWADTIPLNGSFVCGLESINGLRMKSKRNIKNAYTVIIRNR